MKLFIVLTSILVLSSCNKTNVWNYSEKPDEIRNSKSYIASLKSNNNELEITVEQRPQEPPTIKLILTNEEYRCGTTCYALIKLGNETPQTIQLYEESNKITALKQQEVARKITESLKRTNSFIIEIPLKNNEKQQFKFTSVTLKPATFSNEEIKMAKSKGGDALDAFVKMWDKKLEVANETPRISLIPVLLELQEKSKEIDKIEVSDCLLTAKEAHKTYMKERINAIMDFIRDGNSIYPSKKGDIAILDYEMNKHNCMDQKY